MQKVANPTPLFFDVSGALLSGGKIYVGAADDDPETTPVEAFWDSALSIPAAQPLRTVAGLIVNGFTPAAVFIVEADYSMRVRDTNDVLVLYSPSVYATTDSLQPHSATLDALSALSTTSFGRTLLTLSNSAALASATGIPTPLPAAGGTVSGTITRSGAGAHHYWVNAGQTSGRGYYAAVGDADPTSQPGDFCLRYTP